MNKPKAVLFDFGDTILREESFDPIAGTRRLLEMTENPKNVSQKEIQQLAAELNADLMQRRCAYLLELPWQAFNRLLFERLGITLRISLAEAELEFWKAAQIMVPALGIPQVLKTLSKNNIALGIISNSAFHENILRWELLRHSLADSFNFIMSSADYGVRKTHPFLFLTAAAKLAIEPCHIGFVGDSLPNDIEGALSVGMTAIWYNPSGLPGSEPQADAQVQNWEEFIQLVERFS